MPLSSCTRSARPSASSRSRISCERLSCQVTTGVSGLPVSASQASTDSPWWSSPQTVASRAGPPSGPPGPRRRAPPSPRRCPRRPRAGGSRRPPVLGDPAPPGNLPPWREAGAQGLLGAELDSHPGDDLAHPLGDAERGGEPGGADRGDVDQPLTAPRAADQVVDAAAGGAKTRVGGKGLGLGEPREEPCRLRDYLLGGLGPHRPVALVIPVDRGRPGQDLAVDAREDEDPLGPLGGHWEQYLLQSRRRKLEDQELALARIDLEARVPAEA